MVYTTTDLLMAIINGDFHRVTQCASQSRLLYSMWRGGTPVTYALYLKKYDILEYLVNHGADVNIRTQNNKMEPPLFAACRLTDLKAINILLKSPNLNIDQRDFFNRTPLWAAVKYGTLEIVELLLDHGANVNASLCEYECPLYLALQFTRRDPRKKFAKLLIQRGCNVDSRNKCEITPLELSVRIADQNIFRLLVSAGCSVKRENWLSFTRLPQSWKNDKQFCRWISSLQKNPYSLLSLSTYTVRKILVKNWKNLRSCHVQQLPVPCGLKKLILLDI